MPRKPRFSSVAAPVDRPLPLWVLYPLFFVAVYLSHWPLLRLPFFWDEAGYYIPAALDFYQTGSLIPHSTLTNAHPPLPSILLAGWWHVAGYVLSGTRTFVAFVAAAGLLGVFRLARLLAGPAVAAAVTLLTAIYPIWFVQSTLVHADIFAAAFTLWALSFALERYAAPDRPQAPAMIAAGFLFSFAVLSKETAIGTPVALGCWELYKLARRRPADWRWLLTFLLPIVPLVLWFAYHRHMTGFVFGNPEFLRYNVTANFSLGRVAASLWHRVNHLFLHMNLYVATLCTLAALLMPRREDASPTAVLQRPALETLGVIVAANGFAFSILGGALLTRYLLPIYPLLLLIAVAVWRQRIKAWPALAAFTAAAFVAALFVNPPYPFAPEDNLTYRDFVLLHRQAIEIITTRFPYATVLTAWPATTELEHPQLGYARVPIKVTPIDDFSFDQIQRAAMDPGAYDTALVFSTKCVPPPGTLNLTRRSAGTDARFFDFHNDLAPRQVAGLLHGDIVWQASRGCEWAAILRFPRSNEALLLTRP